MNRSIKVTNIFLNTNSQSRIYFRSKPEYGQVPDKWFMTILIAGIGITKATKCYKQFFYSTLCNLNF